MKQITLDSRFVWDHIHMYAAILQKVTYTSAFILEEIRVISAGIGISFKWGDETFWAKRNIMYPPGNVNEEQSQITSGNKENGMAGNTNPERAADNGGHQYSVVMQKPPIGRNKNVPEGLNPPFEMGLLTRRTGNNPAATHSYGIRNNVPLIAVVAPVQTMPLIAVA